MDDMDLLREYARRASDEAFSGLVTRHLDLVYSAALRQVRDAHLAQEVTQAVFLILARKAGVLSEGTILAGWLLRTTRFAARHALRTEHRRQLREQKAAQMEPIETTADEAWDDIAPLLDEAMAQLGETDRNAIALRFFEKKNLREVGEAMGSNEEAAKKRVARALEKLRAFFTKRGATLTGAVLATALTPHVVQAAPAGLTATAVAAVATAGATTSTLLLVKGTMKLMFWTQMKTAIVIATAVVLATGAVTLAATKLAGRAATANITPDPSTPKGALLYLANAFKQGDGRKFIDGAHLTVGNSVEEGAKWAATAAAIVKAQASLHAALVAKFGAEAVRQETPFWAGFDELLAQLLAADERIDGPHARLTMSILGTTAPFVPLLIETNGVWKLAVDISFKGKQKISGGKKNSLQMAFGGNGLHLTYSTVADFNADRMRDRMDSFASQMEEMSREVAATRCKSVSEAWERCMERLESVTEQ